MKKLFFTFLFLIFNIFEIKAQLDTEHWFAPMISRDNGGFKDSDNEQYLHLSTNETEPFDVEIYSGNKLLHTIKNLQKGSPKNQKIEDDYIVYRNENEAGKVINRGLYIKGPKKFYANLRIATRPNADIIISKGKAGIGNKFYAVTSPFSEQKGKFNSMIGIIATEDNTTIKISNNKNAKFTGIITLKDIKLNKGEAFILDAEPDGTNRTGVIGTKIESDKPISITNGNFYGNHTKESGQNIFMDQSVPVDRLGNEFAITKGKGNIGQGTERVIIVATENNTQIYLNDEKSPIATLNEGEYYMTPDTKFIEQKGGHYNLYIRTSKNAYAYHIFSGTDISKINASSGFGFIPPLDNTLPNQIEEIGEIDVFYVVDSYGTSNYNPPTVNLNLITKKGADVSIAGYKLNGPFDLKGNSEWVTYSVASNVKGNITIKSTQPIIAGIIGSKPGLGYGGYFTGSDNIITIKRNGECLPNVSLEVEEGLGSYQWLKNGIPIAGATSNTYKPTQAGNYSVKINNGKSTHTTAETRVENCPMETHIDDSICGVKSYIPKFSQSTQEIDLSSIIIIEHPQYGKVNTNNGIITYEPYVYDGSDNFTYKFCGLDSEFPDCETVYVNLTIGSISVNNAELKTCQENGAGIFDLTSANIGNTANYVVKYYPTLADAEKGTNEITNPTTYPSKGGKVYAKVSSDEGCDSIVSIDLGFHNSPIINVDNYKPNHCDADFDGVVEINLSKVATAIAGENVSEIKFYATKSDAKNGTNPLPENWSYSTNTTIYAKAISDTACSSIAELAFEINTPKKSETLTDKVVCPNKTTTLDAGAGFSYYKWLKGEEIIAEGKNFQSITVGAGTYSVILTSAEGCKYEQEVKVSEFDFAQLQNATLKTCQENGVGIFDLTSANINNTENYAVKYYPSFADAEKGTNEITNPTTYSSKGGKVYAKAFSDTGCSDIVEINLEAYASPVINVANYTANHCDTNFDGKIEVNFAEVSAQIAPNYEVKYYLNEADAKAGNNNFLPNQWSYSADTSVFVRVVSNEGCHTIEKIDFKIKDRLALAQNQAEITLCDDDLDGIIKVNLADYHSLFTNENVIGSYYATLSDAQNERNQLSEVSAKNGDKFYFRLQKAGHCANIAELTIKVNTPKKSKTLTDQLICRDASTILDAGAGFTAYQWSTGETTQSITAKVGTYWVKLTSENGCSYTQFVNVNEIETPTIIGIDIKDGVVSVNAEGGTQPYEYSLDGGRWQTSNVFTNVREGRHRIAVKSQNGCSPTEQEFSIIGLINLITPNGDGINDTIDYSDLRTKANAKFNIYDRYGALVFEGNNSNQFIWDGKAKGRPLPTATYWYEIEWQEPNTNTWVKTASWILLKNRD